MSLLLDALKRAEEAKRAKEASEAGASGQSPTDDTVAPTSVRNFSFEDYEESTPVPGPTLSSDLTLEYEPEPVAPPAPAPFATPLPAPSPISARVSEPWDASTDNRRRESARNVFAAKQTPAAAERGKWLLPLIAVAAVGIGAAGWYVWNEINRISRPLARATAPQSPPAVPTGTRPTTPADEPGAKSAALPPLLPSPAVEAPSPPTSPRKINTEQFTERELLARNLKEAPQTPEQPVELRLTRTPSTARVSPELSTAYQRLAAGQFEQAKILYAQVVSTEPLNIDAHLGLATTGARTGDWALAARHYRKVLEIDPRNSLAIGGLLAISGTVKAGTMEIELRTLIARDPHSAALHFSLGNLYAGERRWTEAQQAYFEAYRLESDNADYVYNLAVSLDQLNQRPLALDYYKKALNQASKTGAQFDPAAVQRRLTELQAG